MNTDPLEKELRELLSRLPDVPVASNFTARVMQAVEQEDLRRSRKWNFSWNWHVFLPRVAFAVLAIGFAGVVLYRHELDTRRATLAQNVALVAAARPLPSVEALKNFDAIRRMSQPRADEELLALLQ